MLWRRQMQSCDDNIDILTCNAQLLLAFRGCLSDWNVPRLTSQASGCLLHSHQGTQRGGANKTAGDAHLELRFVALRTRCSWHLSQRWASNCLAKKPLAMSDTNGSNSPDGAGVRRLGVSHHRRRLNAHETSSLSSFRVAVA
jgi:hypothetical protein